MKKIFYIIMVIIGFLLVICLVDLDAPHAVALLVFTRIFGIGFFLYGAINLSRLLKQVKETDLPRDSITLLKLLQKSVLKYVSEEGCYGICAILQKMRNEKIINLVEKKFLYSLIDDEGNHPVNDVYPAYYFPPGESAPRVKYIDYLIEKQLENERSGITTTSQEES